MEPPHRVTDGVQHPPNLAVSPFVDGELDRRRPKETHLGRRGHAILELDPFR
jgi:hypothetical protein